MDYIESVQRRVFNTVVDAKIVAVKECTKGLADAFRNLDPHERLTPEAVANAIDAVAEQYELALLRTKR